MSKTPEKVKFCYRTAKIEHKTFKEMDAYGVFSTKENGSPTIHLAIDAPIHELANTFLHEYFHFVADTHGVFGNVKEGKLRDDLEEQVCRVFANAVSELIKTNPDEVAWMIDGMKNG